MIAKTISKSITKNSLMLGAFAFAVAVTIAVTENITRELRAASERKVQSMALEQVIASDKRDNILLDHYFPVSDTEFLKLKETKNIYIARKNGEVTAFIIPTHAPDGYSGSIHSIVGINVDGSIAGVRVVQHGETPGLGDWIEFKKSKWILAFEGKSLTNLAPELWKVKKDKGVFDQFTGATISPRAVTASIFHAMQFYEKNKASLMSQANTQALTITTDKKPKEAQ